MKVSHDEGPIFVDLGSEEKWPEDLPAFKRVLSFLYNGTYDEDDIDMDAILSKMEPGAQELTCLRFDQLPTWRLGNNMQVYFLAERLQIITLRDFAMEKVLEVVDEGSTTAKEVAEVFEKYIVQLDNDDPLRKPSLLALIDNSFRLTPRPEGPSDGSCAESPEFMEMIARCPKAAVLYVQAMATRVRRLEHNIKSASDAMCMAENCARDTDGLLVFCELCQKDTLHVAPGKSDPRPSEWRFKCEECENFYEIAVSDDEQFWNTPCDLDGGEVL